MTRKVTLRNFVISNLWHRIDVEDEWEMRRADDGATLRRWKTRESRKAYTFREAGVEQPGERYWLSYRYQLEEFVNKIRGREGSGAWVDHESSIAQMRMIDMAYAKAGLPLRPTSSFQIQIPDSVEDNE